MVREGATMETVRFEEAYHITVGLNQDKMDIDRLETTQFTILMTASMKTFFVRDEGNEGINNM